MSLLPIKREISIRWIEHIPPQRYGYQLIAYNETDGEMIDCTFIHATQIKAGQEQRKRIEFINEVLDVI